MAPAANVLHASIGGSVELLTLSLAGAFLAHARLLTSPVASSLSKALYNLFIPCLVFGSVLDTVHSASKAATSGQGDAAALQELWVPVALAIVVFAGTAVIAFPLTRIIASGKEDAVRRAVFLCLILGNSNTMPLLVMQSLCSTFPPLQEGGRCYTQAMGYASLYMTVVNIIAWTALFQYLLLAPDSSHVPREEVQSLMENGLRNSYGTAGTEKVVNENVDKISKVTPTVVLPQNDNRVREAIKRALLSPPFLTVLLASGLAFIPTLPEAFLTESGALQPLLLSINTIGQVVVPVSCMIVGSELYRSFTKEPSSEKEFSMQPEETFGTQATLFIILVRMVLLPLIGRVGYVLLGLDTSINSPQLSIFVLSQWNVPTANNTVIMASIAAESLPRIGKQIREDVSRCVFWQFLATPFFLTLNTAAALDIQFPSV